VVVSHVVVIARVTISFLLFITSYYFVYSFYFYNGIYKYCHGFIIVVIVLLHFCVLRSPSSIHFHLPCRRSASRRWCVFSSTRCRSQLVALAANISMCYRSCYIVCMNSASPQRAKSASAPARLRQPHSIYPSLAS
jgi:hypothetical protein